MMWVLTLNNCSQHKTHLFSVHSNESIHIYSFFFHSRNILLRLTFYKREKKKPQWTQCGNNYNAVKCNDGWIYKTRQQEDVNTVCITNWFWISGSVLNTHGVNCFDLQKFLGWVWFRLCNTSEETLLVAEVHTCKKLRSSGISSGDLGA